MMEATASQPTCMGCCLNPGFINPFGPYINPNPFTHDPTIFNVPLGPPPQSSYFQPCSVPIFVDNLKDVKLTDEETELLKTLGNAYNLFTTLDKRSEADNKEFVDAIHRLQQIVALRVARRANPEVCAQPE